MECVMNIQMFQNKDENVFVSKSEKWDYYKNDKNLTTFVKPDNIKTYQISAIENTPRKITITVLTVH
jgi:hypothetical protein